MEQPVNDLITRARGREAVPEKCSYTVVGVIRMSRARMRAGGGRTRVSLSGKLYYFK